MVDKVDLPFNTTPIELSDLVIDRAFQFASILEELPFVELIATERSDQDPKLEVVIFEVEVERPQELKHLIHRKELLAAIFSDNVGVIPDVLALRPDFPHVPHLNLRIYEYPKSLCLFEESPHDIFLRWTPLMFVERIREWLALTAKGELHHEDQPLEPLLSSSEGMIILTDQIYDQITASDKLPVYVSRMSSETDPKLMLMAQAYTETNDEEEQPPFVATGFMCEITTHGVIQKQPVDLKALGNLIHYCGCEFICELRERLKEWKRIEQHKSCIDARLIIFVGFPKARYPGRSAEEMELWGFLCKDTIRDIGISIGIWEMKNGEIGSLVPTDESREGEDIKILPLRPVRSFSRQAASNFSGVKKYDDCNIMLIGVGSLGSLVFINLIRSGLGTWTLVDDDRLLPHNLARHALNGLAVGYPKTECLSFIANNMIDGAAISSAMTIDVLAPKEQKDLLAKAYSGSSIIIDASASVSVARHIALDVDSSARRISMFFNPSGNASIILIEDITRRTPLDILEMQYYRLIASTEQLADHLMFSNRRIRYAQSCRDLTSQIPQDVVSLHASLCSNAIKQMLHKEESFGGVWCFTSPLHDVEFIPVATSPIVKIECADWKIRTDEVFITRLAGLRASKLPNETGGIVLGSYDMHRRIIYLVDTIPSPPDSEEWPTVYIRGCKGLSAQLASIEQCTGGNLVYVGEWHSHPEGGGILPSPDDLTAFGWLRSEMLAAGLPPLMIIVGDDCHIGVYVEVMDR